MATPDPTTLASGILAGDRRALARGITLIESSRPDQRSDADDLVNTLLPHTGSTLRVGITGPPGVGKSTFIETLGLHLVDLDHRVAVLAVDPTSTITGGSILGDKTRMEELTRSPSVFIRPSPGGSELGGVARRTREAMVLCEAFGHDIVLVETIGVGQSEVAVADMVDLFLVLMNPGGGDELQGIKRGIMELADLVVVNKADGDLAPAAGRTAADYRNALHLLRPRWEAWSAQALSCSAVEGRGVIEVWEAVADFRTKVEASGELARHRSDQAVAWLWSEIRGGLLDRFRSDPAVGDSLAGVEAEVAAGRLSPVAAARDLLDRAHG